MRMIIDGFASSAENQRKGSKMNEEYINFGIVARSKMGLLCQYASRYLHGKIEGYPNLAEGLRIQGDPINNYYSVKIHKDDVEEFVWRYKEYVMDERLKVLRIKMEQNIPV